jgi:hypothetical protein
MQRSRRYDPDELTKDLDAARAHRAMTRAPLYGKALAECRALAVRGVKLEDLGREIPWPAAFAPLDKPERVEVRKQAIAALERRRAAAVTP